MRSGEKRRLARAATWYVEEQLEFDKRLIRYHYDAIRGFLRGPLGLELGPAEGQMTPLLLKHFTTLTVVDGSAPLLDKIPRAPNLVKIHSLFEDFTPRHQFDSIVMNRVLEHVRDPVGLLRLARRWLSPNGRLLIGVPNADSFHRLAAVHMRLLRRATELNDRDRRLGHRRVYTRDALLLDIRKAKLAVVTTGGVFFKPLSNVQIDATWTDAMMDGFFKLGSDFPDNAAEIYAVCRRPSIDSRKVAPRAA
jgi:SAM-dependent methyltransferase